MCDPLDCDESLFEGLKSLSESAFPKTCHFCGRHYETAEAFLKETSKVPMSSGLKASMDEDQTSVVELYRNCVCGSTLMDFFSDRRDCSPRGIKQRQKFGQVLALLEKRGMSADAARTELLKLMRGQQSHVLQALGVKIKASPTSCAGNGNENL